MAVTQRRTQRERTEATRRKLLDAARETIVERGYAGATTAVISKRAGVSRGAQLHHFPTKTELMRALMDDLVELRSTEFREALARLPPDRDRIEAGMELFWEILSRDDVRYPWLELTVAARTSPELAEHGKLMARKMRDAVVRLFGELYPKEAQENPFAEVIPVFSQVVFEGLLLQELSEDSRTADLVLDSLRQIATLIGLIRRPT